MKKEKLNTYISDTRFPFCTDDSMDEYYNNIFSSIKNILSNFSNITPPVYLVYSLYRQSEIISIDNELSIIYDRYLGETLHQMTKIFMSPQEELKATAFSCKLLTEALRRNGMLKKALPSAYLTQRLLKEIYADDSKNKFHISLKYFEIDDLRKHKRKNNEINIFECDLLTIRQITAISEVFVIFHEISHFLFKKNMINDFIKQNLDECEQSLNHSSTMIQHLISNVQKSTKKVFESDDFRVNLLEEMLCDKLAIEFTFASARNNYTADNIVLSILLCSLHLRWLKQIDSIANCDDGSNQFYDSTIRGYWLRDLLSHELEKNKMISHLIYKSSPIVEQYQYVFLSRSSTILKILNNKELIDESNLMFGEYFNSDMISASVIIDSLIGWNTYDGNISKSK